MQWGVRRGGGGRGSRTRWDASGAGREQGLGARYGAVVPSL